MSCKCRHAPVGSTAYVMLRKGSVQEAVDEFHERFPGLTIKYFEVLPEWEQQAVDIGLDVPVYISKGLLRGDVYIGIKHRKEKAHVKHSNTGSKRH